MTVNQGSSKAFTEPDEMKEATPYEGEDVQAELLAMDKRENNTVVTGCEGLLGYKSYSENPDNCRNFTAKSDIKAKRFHDNVHSIHRKV